MNIFSSIPLKSAQFYVKYLFFPDFSIKFLRVFTQICPISPQNLSFPKICAVIPKNRAVDLIRFRIYLSKKYKVEKAYYFLGCTNGVYQDLYDAIQEAGFILKFRKHNIIMLGKKKGNVDSDIIFSIMKKMYRKEKFGKIILVSGDGDYKQLVDFLIEENKFEKILFPNKKFASSLYKQLTRVYYDYLENVKDKISKNRQKKGGP